MPFRAWIVMPIKVHFGTLVPRVPHPVPQINRNKQPQSSAIVFVSSYQSAREGFGLCGTLVGLFFTN